MSVSSKKWTSDYVSFLVNAKLDTLLNNGQAKNVSRWFNFLANQSGFKQCSGKVAPSKKSTVWGKFYFCEVLLTICISVILPSYM